MGGRKETLALDCVLLMNSVLINLFKHEGNKMIWSASVTRSNHSTAECRLICNFTRNKVSTQRKWKVLTSTFYVQ